VEENEHKKEGGVKKLFYSPQWNKGGAEIALRGVAYKRGEKREGKSLEKMIKLEEGCSGRLGRWELKGG